MLERYRDIAFDRFDKTQNAVRNLNRELAGTAKVEVQRMGNIEELREFLLESEGIGCTRVEWLNEAGNQPEEHLDNAFIAERTIRNMRKHKSSRQFLFAAHSSNVPVLGDAELIAVLSGSSDRGMLEHAGSIDKQDVCERVASILEGGKAAFDMRKLKYGY